MSRLPTAEDFETLAAATVLERGPVPIKASKGRTRLLKVVDKSGAVVGLVTHGKVLEGAARVAEIEIAVIDERRSEAICCVDCGALRPTSGKGRMPERCKPCAKKRVLAQQGEYALNAKAREQAQLEEWRERSARRRPTESMGERIARKKREALEARKAP